MKLNKKLIVPFLSTVVGLSIAGGLGGAFAWYQFNSQVRTGLVGTSIAEGGVLQIGYETAPNTITWGTEKYITGATLRPVTFGALTNTGALSTAYAYGMPEAGAQVGTDYTTGWTKFQNKDGFYQYDIYLRALVADPNAAGDPTADIDPGYKLAAKDVYISSMTLEDAANDENRTVADALRVHYQVANGGNGLISKNAISSTAPLDLYGKLDLNADGANDTYNVDPWDTAHYHQEVIYGINGETQVTKGINDIVQARDAEGKMPATANEKRICTTSTSVMTKITVTVWLEGWALLPVTTDSTPTTSAVWNPKLNAGVQVHVGMVFDAGRNILG